MSHDHASGGPARQPRSVADLLRRTENRQSGRDVEGARKAARKRQKTAAARFDLQTDYDPLLAALLEALAQPGGEDACEHILEAMRKGDEKHEPDPLFAMAVLLKARAMAMNRRRERGDL